MLLKELIEECFIEDSDDKGIYHVKKGYVVKLDFFTEDYVSMITNDRFYSMASDSMYVIKEIDMSDVVVFTKMLEFSK